MVGSGVREVQPQRPLLGLWRAVGHLHHELQHVAFADEPRRVGLHHQILGGHHLVVQPAVAQRRVVRKGHELPLRERLGHGEADPHRAFLVGGQVREEERRFGQVLPRANRTQVGSLAGRAAFASAIRVDLVAGDQRTVGRHGRTRVDTFGHRGRQRRMPRLHLHGPGGGRRHASGTEKPKPEDVRGNLRRKLGIADFNFLVIGGESPNQMLEVPPTVLKLRHHPRLIAVEQVQPLRPLVRQVSVQRGIVQGGHHLGSYTLGIRPRNDSRPCFLLAGQQLRGESLPSHVELLVRPGHVNLHRLDVGPVFANHRHPKREATPHAFRDRQGDFLLGDAGPGPEGFEHLALSLELHVSLGIVVAAAPHGDQFLARLYRRCARSQQERNFDLKLLGRRVQHGNRQASLDGFAEAVLGFQHGLVGTLAQFNR